MSSYGAYGGGQQRVPGSRRDKVRGYLRAANELRQTYQASLEQKLQASEDGSMPGDFPDVDIIRSGKEEMILFPSYARPHVKRDPDRTGQARPQPGTHESIEHHTNSGDADYWKREWERYEDANAVVDVDVRGWIYSPQSGPLNRKNRLLIAVARRLSGIYAPQPSPEDNRLSSQNPSDRQRLDDNPTKHEDEIAAREAENIARHGQMEADAAVRGSYSRSTASDHSSSRSSTFSSNDTLDQDPGHVAYLKRQSWNQPAEMSREELIAADKLLMSRLKPFMTVALANTPITVFFFNDEKSISKTVITDESGHFNLRAALDFVPQQVRVLASENLSATEDVIVTEGQGVSLISDIDDTIKHSAIASGAREIFKNTFVRELGDLTIKGVKEWYTSMANMGVKMHYVSNSPWQLYPLLCSYFSLAGLPHGSFHLKQYSGMLQGIFEPAAERKRGSLDRIMSDFPERKFILVGDSGEADLEVYTDVVLDHPGRVLGVFIRDVTSPIQKGFFDQSVSHPPPDTLITKDRSRFSSSPQNDEAEVSRPALPARPRSDPEPEVEDLIDFSEDAETKAIRPKATYQDDMKFLDPNGKQPPNRPNKPSSLRNFSTQSMPPTNHERLSTSDTEGQDSIKKKGPPPPPKPRRASKDVKINLSNPESSSLAPLSRPPFSSTRQNQASSTTNVSRQTSSASNRSTNAAQPPPPPVSRTNTSTSMSSSYSRNEQEGYVASARRQLVSAYNSLPQIRSVPDPTRLGGDGRGGPPVPPRRGISSYPAAAARWATGASGGDPMAGGDGGAPGAPYDKKLEIWKRRWQRSEEIMQQRGVVLRTWRIGSDVMDECIALVKREMEGKDRKRS
ncbi:hypothetical protein PV10_05225 [Exophiala mesophila]|uniref:Phosphatidate phosphatase APP1 catalytic domain-containing protein n=1 Tax=Exophiala mesophila TaxID=212818 RepID=A0A0D2A507_EXOME|nr:uncharacterized protein PV10_05225 [Exophiala mesophila]KIV94068.1 hypothetical protein PV10_05225 [Exophiala mesophila]